MQKEVLPADKLCKSTHVTAVRWYLKRDGQKDEV